MNKKRWVKFARGSQKTWEELQQNPEKIDNDTLYFIYEDEDSSTIGKLYLGKKLISDNDILNLENYYTKEEINDLLPSKISELENDDNFITEESANNLILNAISNITNLHFEIVQEKPIENIQENVIYLILKNSPDENNIYNEWIYINNNWELIGTTKIDLSQYYNKSEINNFLNQKVDITTTVAGLALNNNIQAQELKENLDLYPIVPTYQVSEGSGIAYYPNTSSEIYLSLKVGDVFQCRLPGSIRLYFKESSDNYKTILDSDLLSYEIVRRLGDYNISDDSYIMRDISSSSSLWNCEKGDIITGKNNVYFLQNYDSNGYNKTLYWKKLLTIDDLQVKEDISNKVISLSSASTDEQYPSAKTVYDFVTSQTSDLSTKMDLAPFNPTAEEIVTLPAGQFYDDTVNHKGVVKGGQSFYDTVYIDENYRKTYISSSYRPPIIVLGTTPKFLEGDKWVFSASDYANCCSYTLINYGIDSVKGHVYYFWKPDTNAYRLSDHMPITQIFTQRTIEGETWYETPPISVGDVIIKKINNKITAYYICINTYFTYNKDGYETQYMEVSIPENYYTKTEIDQKDYLTLETLPIYDGTVI